MLNPFWILWIDYSQNRKSDIIIRNYGEVTNDLCDLVYSELQSDTNKYGFRGPWRGPDKRLRHDNLLTICMWYFSAFMSIIFALNSFHYELAKLFIKQLYLTAFCLCHSPETKILSGMLCIVHHVIWPYIDISFQIRQKLEKITSETIHRI
jgi:hypothetical protein